RVSAEYVVRVRRRGRCARARASRRDHPTTGRGRTEIPAISAVAALHLPAVTVSGGRRCVVGNPKPDGARRPSGARVEITNDPNRDTNGPGPRRAPAAVGDTASVTYIDISGATKLHGRPRHGQ